MPQGLQIWDASGALVFDTTLRTATLFGIIHITGSGSVTDADFAKGDPFWFYLPLDYSAVISLNVTFSSNTFSWSSATPSVSPNGNFIYGIR